MEKSVSFRGEKTGSKDEGESSRDFLMCVESTRETTDLKLKLSIITELINLLQSVTTAQHSFTEWRNDATSALIYTLTSVNQQTKKRPDKQTQSLSNGQRVLKL